MSDIESKRWEIYGSFLSDSSEFAINAHELQEVVRYDKAIASVPLSPAYFLGIFSLRDSIIPVVNLRALLGQSQVTESDENCIAIIHVEGVRIGLLFDSTSEVLQVTPSQLKQFDYAGEEHSTPVSGTISMNNGERLVQILDAQKFINLDQIPINKSHSSADDFSYRTRAKSKCITFFSSGILYGFRIDAIREIIVEPEIVASGIRSKTCMGQAELRGTSFPVIDFARLCNGDKGIGGDGAEKRVIIANIGDQPVGFLVDGVDSIVEYYLDTLQLLPQFNNGDGSFCQGCISDEGHADISMVDHDKLYSVPEVTAPVSAIAEGNAYAIRKVTAEQAAHTPKTYLVVQVDFGFALPVESIIEIIEVPGKIIPIARGPSFVEGMFNLRKLLVTIVDLRSLYEFPAGKHSENQKLVIVKSHGNYIALKVDAVVDIFTTKPGSVHEAPGSIVQGASASFKEDAAEAIFHKGKVLIAFDFKAMMARILPELIEQVHDQAA